MVSWEIWCKTGLVKKDISGLVVVLVWYFIFCSELSSSSKIILWDVIQFMEPGSFGGTLQVYKQASRRIYIGFI